jgi:hypothetical protein
VYPVAAFSPKNQGEAAVSHCAAPPTCQCWINQDSPETFSTDGSAIKPEESVTVGFTTVIMANHLVAKSILFELSARL